MNRIVHCLYYSFLSTSIFFCSFLNANGLDDLQQALTKLQQSSDISGTLSFEVEETRGKSKDEDFKFTQGSIDAHIGYDQNGLTINYPKWVMQQVESEIRLSADNEDADIPILKAINALRVREVNAALSQAVLLEQTISNAKFISEENIEFQGQAARELLLELPIDSIVREKRIREYVDNFDSEFKVIINSQGIPLASTLTYSGKGRAYIVLYVEASGERSESYQVVDGRLISVDYFQQSRYDSTFGEGTRKSHRTFVIRN